MPTKFTPEGDHSLPVFVEAPTHISSNGIISEQGSSNVTIAEPGKEFEVQLTDEDASNPKTWSNLRRWYLTCLGGLLVLNATFASAAPSSIVPTLKHELHLSDEVGILTVSLFVAGYCVGPIVWGPLSETYGRRPIFLFSFGVYTIFQIACAVARTTPQLLIFRFIGGTFAAAPLANSGALVADLWNAKERGTAMTIFTLAPFAGPVLGPIVSGYTIVGGLSWRWTFWILACFAGACWILTLLTLPETYAPKLTERKAAHLRKTANEQRYFAATERRTTEWRTRLAGILLRPWVIMLTEPMLIATTLYLSFLYGCVYLLFEAYPIVFAEGHGLNLGATGLMFVPLPLGAILATMCYFFVFNPRYVKFVATHAASGSPVPPEIRLEMACWSAPLFAVAFFWFGWTSFTKISFWAPMMAGLFMGFSIQALFLSLFNYIVDVYTTVAASALSSSTVIRSLFGAAFPLFATQMYQQLNPRWASTLLGCIALLMTPIPFVLVRFGPRLRKNSRYSPSSAPAPQPQIELGPRKGE